MDKIAYYKAYIYKTAEEIRYNKRNKQHINKIDTLAQGNLMLQLKYKDKKGKITTRIVEPYKINGYDFWGYDVEKGSIRRFKIPSIKAIKGSKDIFKPRWPIETAKVE